jgi:ABC-type branched-subunit amino acid transport system ATPase component
MGILDVQGLCKRFYGLDVLVDVDVSIPPNRIVGLIGPNGSGKSTLFNCITGIYRADRGRVIFAGCDITQSSGDQISLQGLTRSFQMVQIYPQLSVFSNLLIAIQEHQERSVLGRILRTGKIQQAEVVAMERANYVMREFGLESLRDVPAGVLSYGQRKLVEFAAVLMPDPKLILLDEPAAAINPTMINQMKEHIRECQRLGKTVFLVEHNMNFVMDLCEIVVVLDQGRKIMEGTPTEARNDLRVMEAYFGR